MKVTTYQVIIRLISPIYFTEVLKDTAKSLIWEAIIQLDRAITYDEFLKIKEIVESKFKKVKVELLDNDKLKVASFGVPVWIVLPFLKDILIGIGILILAITILYYVAKLPPEYLAIVGTILGLPIAIAVAYRLSELMKKYMKAKE